MKKNLLFIFFLFLFIFINIKVKALVEPTREFYVNDYANVLSKETEDFIMNNSAKLANATNAQIVVVTVKSLEGKDIETYATDLFRKFGIGSEKEDNGLLILLALQERKARIEVGYGLEGVITDGLAGRYLDDYFVPYLKENKWDEAIKNGYSALYKKISDYYKIDTSEIKVENIEYDPLIEIKKHENLRKLALAVGLISGIIYGLFIKKDENTIRMVFVIICFLATLANIYIFYLLLKLPVSYGLADELSEVLGGEILLAFIGALLSSFIVNPRSNGKKGGYGIGYIGGSSSGSGYSSSSGGGYSSGGGFGGFSGGGGSSGGGGASRGF